MSVPHLTGTPPFRRFTRRRLLATTGLGAAGALLAACAGAATPTPPPAPKPAAPAAPAQTPTTAPKPAAPAAPAPTATTAPAAAPAKPTAVPAAQARPSAEKIQLRFLQSSVGDDDANFIRKVFADYGKDHPNVSVEYEMIPFDDYFKKIGLVLSAGTGPDMYWVTEIFAYVDAGHTRELPQEMAEDLKKDFVQIAIDNCTYKGKQWAMPWQGGHRLMYYNKDLFKEAGITTLPETWDDLVDAAKKTTKFEGGTMVQQGIILPWGPDGATSFCGFFYAAGGRWMDDTAEKPMFNSEAGKAALGFWVDLTQKHKVSSPKFLFGQGIQGSFVLGKSAMQIAGPWNLGPYPKQNPKLNFGIMFPPARTKGGPRGWDDAPWKLLVNPKTRYADPAWEIIKLWTSKDSLVNAMSIGVVSYRKSALEEFKPKANEHWKVFIDAMPYNRARPFKNWRAIAVRFGAQIEKALLGTVTVEQALADGEKEVKKAIDEGAQL